MNGQRALGLLALVLLSLAAGAVVVPGIGVVEAMTRPDVSVPTNGQARADLPEHADYGIYFDDRQNHGYTANCDVADKRGPIETSLPGFNFTTSDTESLDLTFNTGSGHVVITCDTTADRVTARPIPNFAETLIGGGIAALLGLMGLCAGALWLARKSSGAPEPRSANPA